MKNVSMLVARVGIWNAKLCSVPVEMIMRQKPSDRSIFCQSISQASAVSVKHEFQDGRECWAQCFDAGLVFGRFCRVVDQQLEGWVVAG
jgi:hypothetical protein